MNAQLINRHVQAVAIQFIAYSAPIDAIAKFVAQSMGDDAPDMAELQHYLRKEETHKQLSAEYEVGLWRGPGDQWRLVSLATPPTIEQIEYRLSTYPTSTSTQCAWCLIDEKNRAEYELIKLHDLHGRPVHRRLVHKACYRPWSVMVTQLARSN